MYFSYLLCGDGAVTCCLGITSIIKSPCEKLSLASFVRLVAKFIH